MVRNSTPTHTHEFLTINITLHIKSEQKVIRKYYFHIIKWKKILKKLKRFCVDNEYPLNYDL